MVASVGIVVIGRNEGTRLVRCLRSASLGPTHLIYVDSGSTDSSVADARELGAHVVELDSKTPFTAARARDTGFEALAEVRPDIQYVQFIDGDCELDPDWIDTAIGFLEKHPDVALVCGRRRERRPDASVYNRLCDDEWDTPVGEALSCGGDSMVRAKAYKDCGGFRPSLICGEEPEFCVRLRQRGWKVWRLDADMTLHDAAMFRFRDWWRRNVRTGFGFAQVSRLHRASPHGIWRQETKRALLWGGLLPALILCAGLWQPAGFLAVGVYPLQIATIASRRDWRVPYSWVYASFLVLAKFPECYGVLKCHAFRLLGRHATIIEYKGPES